MTLKDLCEGVIAIGSGADPPAFSELFKLIRMDRECENMDFFRHGESDLRHDKERSRSEMGEQGRLRIKGSSRGCLEPGSCRNY